MCTAQIRRFALLQKWLMTLPLWLGAISHAGANEWFEDGFSITVPDNGTAGGLRMRDKQDKANQWASVTWGHYNGVGEFSLSSNRGGLRFMPLKTFSVWFSSVAPYAYKTGGGDWGNLSDSRVKTDIQDFTVGLDAVLQLRPRSFKYNGLDKLAPNDGRTYVGVVAQEAMTALPNAVKPLTSRKLDDQSLLTFDTSSLTYVLINSVKEQAETLRRLRSKFEELKAVVCGDYPSAEFCNSLVAGR